MSARFARPPRKLLPGRLLDTYLFGHVAEATLRGLGMFVMLLMFFAVISATRKLLDASLSWGGALELIVYQLPRIFLFTLPMSLLYGTLHAFAEMSGRGEVIGMWGGGMSFKRMLVPPLLWASLLAASAFWVQEAIVPGAESAKDKVLANQIQNSTLVQRDVKLPSTLKDGSTVLIEGEEFNVGTKTLLRPLVTQRNAQGDLDLGVRADSARWDAQKKKWILENPHFRRWNETESSSSDANTIQSNAGVFELEAGDPSTLGKQARTRKENLLEYNYEFVSSADLQAWRRVTLQEAQKPGLTESQRAEWRKRADSAAFGIHDKIATPLVCVALILIAAPLGLRPQRSAGGFSLGLSLMILLIYYVVWTWATQVGKQGTANPLFMAYLPLLLTIAVGGALTWKKVR